MGETSTILRVIVPSEDELIAHIIITFRPIERLLTTFGAYGSLVGDAILLLMKRTLSGFGASAFPDDSARR